MDREMVGEREKPRTKVSLHCFELKPVVVSDPVGCSQDMKNLKPVLDHTSAEMKRNKNPFLREFFLLCFVNRGRARAVGREHETLMRLGL